MAVYRIDVPRDKYVHKNPADNQIDVLGDALGWSVLQLCDIQFDWFWDQWAVCHLKCEHGLYKGTAAGLNLLAAFLKAADKMREAHPTCGKPTTSEALSMSTKEMTSYTDPCAKFVDHEGPCDYF